MASELISQLEPYLDDYFPLVLKEFNAAGSHDSDALCFIGCGSLPLTAFIFEFYRSCARKGRLSEVEAEISVNSGKFSLSNKLKFLLNEFLAARMQGCGSRIILVDRSVRALDLALSFFHKTGFTGVTGECCDAEFFVPPSDARSLIHIAAMINQREGILKKLFARLGESNKPAIVIVRHVGEDDPRVVLYEPLSGDFVRNLCDQFGVRVKAAFHPENGTNLMVGFTIFETCYR